MGFLRLPLVIKMCFFLQVSYFQLELVLVIALRLLASNARPRRANPPPLAEDEVEQLLIGLLAVEGSKPVGLSLFA